MGELNMEIGSFDIGMSCLNLKYSVTAVLVTELTALQFFKNKINQRQQIYCETCEKVLHYVVIFSCTCGRVE